MHRSCICYHDYRYTPISHNIMTADRWSGSHSLPLHHGRWNIFVLKVERQKKKNMGKNQGEIFMAVQLSQNISKAAALVRCSQGSVVNSLIDFVLAAHPHVHRASCNWCLYPSPFVQRCLFTCSSRLLFPFHLSLKDRGVEKWQIQLCSPVICRPGKLNNCTEHVPSGHVIFSCNWQCVSVRVCVSIQSYFWCILKFKQLSEATCNEAHSWSDVPALNVL